MSSRQITHNRFYTPRQKKAIQHTPHPAVDLNTSADAAKATADMVNLHRNNVEFREMPGLNHFTLQGEMTWEALAWLQK
ncbi:hypothetical protein P3342_006572 [Pyrenophora teres f. teres]|nr:hypothetical protein P3342_006572 [Pyrenophora teres f. teres]